ncbi:MAG: hypothetical protein ABH875_02920, partial [Candidatus Omnitrophota bacterium]
SGITMITSEFSVDTWLYYYMIPEAEFNPSSPFNGSYVGCVNNSSESITFDATRYKEGNYCMVAYTYCEDGTGNYREIISDPVHLYVQYPQHLSPEIVVSGNTTVRLWNGFWMYVEALHADDVTISGLPQGAYFYTYPGYGGEDVIYGYISYYVDKVEDFDITITATRGGETTEEIVHVSVTN